MSGGNFSPTMRLAEATFPPHHTTDMHDKTTATVVTHTRCLNEGGMPVVPEPTTLVHCIFSCFQTLLYQFADRLEPSLLCPTKIGFRYEFVPYNSSIYLLTLEPSLLRCIHWNTSLG